MEIIIPLVAGALIYNAIKTEDPKTEYTNSMVIETVHLPSGTYKHNNENPMNQLYLGFLKLDKEKI